MRRLVDNPIQRYAWGSLDAIPRLLGAKPDGRPQAEMWLGAHERAASRLLGPEGSPSLLDVVRADPLAHLGQGWAAEGRMPFLAKVVATAAPLSLQVHPDAERARRWFAHEEAQGIGRDAAKRCCPDEVAKVEMVWALSEFRALCGFRDTEETVRWLEALDVPAFEPTAEALRRDGTEALRAEVSRLLRIDAPHDVVAAVRARAGMLQHDRRWSSSARVATELATRYPDDPAVPMALLLRPLVLAPGEAMFVRTGQPHSYLSGAAFEVQANSDNILRAGLTGKHVDVDLLLEALVTSGEGVAAIRGVIRGDEEVFAPDTRRFALGIVRSASGRAPLEHVPGPQVFLCVDGGFGLDDGTDELSLHAGDAAYAPAEAAGVRVSGDGTLLRVTTGRSGTSAPRGTGNGNTHSREGDNG
jgi:mannose-6-phosphate isomerase